MKRDSLPAHATARARKLRRDATDAEKRVWRALREKLPSAKFRRQVPFGPYITDFASHSAKLIVELDGGQHADRVEQDAARTHFLESEGYRVIRFWNTEVMENMDGVIDMIALEIGRAGIEPARPLPSSRPSPTRGEGA
jgi:very-short-patch-repair endonuclease